MCWRRWSQVGVELTADGVPLIHVVRRNSGPPRERGDEQRHDKPAEQELPRRYGKPDLGCLREPSWRIPVTEDFGSLKVGASPKRPHSKAAASLQFINRLSLTRSTSSKRVAILVSASARCDKSGFILRRATPLPRDWV